MKNKPAILLAGKGLLAFYLEDQNTAQSHMATKDTGMFHRLLSFTNPCACPPLLSQATQVRLISEYSLINDPDYPIRTYAS